MNIALRILLLFVFALVCEIALSLGIPGMYVTQPFSWQIRAADYVSSAIAIFVLAGVIPVIYWAARRFGRERANGVTLVWALLIAVCVLTQYSRLGHPG
jgi:hypothetical protein